MATVTGTVYISIPGGNVYTVSGTGDVTGGLALVV